jgi:hypothetical protein
MINLLTLTAEVGGIALALQLASSVEPRLWVVPAAFAVWLVIWRVKFSTLETVFGLMGLAMIVVVVAVVQLHPDWSTLWHHASHPSVAPRRPPTYFYCAIALFGAAMTPTGCLLLGSGRSGPDPIVLNRANVFLGFPLGGCCSASWRARRRSSARRRRRPPLAGRTADQRRPQESRPGFIIVGCGVHPSAYARDRALLRLHDVAVLRLAVGQARQTREASRFHLVVLCSIVVAVPIGVLPSIDQGPSTRSSCRRGAAPSRPILVVARRPHLRATMSTDR